MQATITFQGQKFSIDLSHFWDLSIPVKFSLEQLEVFDIPHAKCSPVRIGNFYGDTNKGGSVNCSEITFCPHGNGTHTECIGHISKEKIYIWELLHSEQLFRPCMLVSILPVPISTSGETTSGNHLGTDLVITRTSLLSAILVLNEDQGYANNFLQTLVIRTLPNGKEKCQRNWSFNGPPAYFTLEAVSLLVELGVRHLLVDLPTVDRDDNTYLPVHKIFFRVLLLSSSPMTVETVSQSILATEETKAKTEATAFTLFPKEKYSYEPYTITELCYIDDQLIDGHYFLDLQVSPFEMDAAPSRPLLFPVKAEKACS